VVDDEVRTLRGLKETMPWAEWGIDEVLTAGGAADARELYDRFEPDILLTDIRMPHTDGFELAGELRDRHPSLPIIFMSAYGDVGHLRRAFQLRPIDFLLKPIEPADLESAVSRARAEVEHVPPAADPVVDPNGDAQRLDAIIVDRICRHIAEGDAVSADELAIQWDEVVHDERYGWYVCLATPPDSVPGGVLSGVESPVREESTGESPKADRPAGARLDVLGSAVGTDVRVSIVAAVGVPPRPDAESMRRLVGLDPHELTFATDAHPQLASLPAIACELLRSRGASSRYVEDAKRFMRAHYAEPLTVDDVARAVYLTPSYICRLFKERTGHTVKGFLVRERIHRARLQIDRGGYYELSDVARECGFGTYRYFTASFKRIVGVTPSAYAARRGRS